MGRMKIVAGSVAIAMVLSACSDQPKLWKRSEIEMIAEDFSDASSINNASVIDHNARSAEKLAERVEELERRVASQQDMIDELYKNQNKMSDWVNEAHGL